MARNDPRDIITPDAFTVAPHLLGLPLASPTRRAVALGIDLLLLSILVNVGGSVLFGVAVAWLFFRVALRREGVKRLPAPVRWTFGVVAVLVLFGVASSLWGRMFDGDDEDEPRRRAAAELRTAGAVLGGERGELGSARALEEVGGAPPPAPPPDSLARAYAAALAEGDTTAAAALRPELGALLAADTLRSVRAELLAERGRVRELRRENERLEEELEEAREETGLLDTLVRWADDLGIGFGWAGLYFTAFLALWRGQTPGKRMLGIRVLRLDGEPITWWTSFERFGGYVAGFATGLLDFFLIVRDRNRQTLHDKIVDTVVVRETGSGPVS